MEPLISEKEEIKKRKSHSSRDFEMIRRLGEGAFGVVYLIKKQNQELALKEVSKSKLIKAQRAYTSIVEKELLKAMDHPGIIKIKGAFTTTSKLCLYLEYCEKGSLHNYLLQHKELFTEEMKRFYIAEMINILEYLHSNGIVHRDLKPENLMLSQSGHLKLIDFGTAEISECQLLSESVKQQINEIKNQKAQSPQVKMKFSEENENSDSTSSSSEQVEIEEIKDLSPVKRLKKRKSTFVGTCSYLSPELLESNICESSSDLWALGCIIYFLYYQKSPFTESADYLIFEKIKNPIIDFSQNHQITDSAKDLIKSLLKKNPEERLGSNSEPKLSFAALKNHQFFKGINIDSIFSMEVPELAKINIKSPQKEKRMKKMSEHFEGFIM